jgi:hypothetical protein
LRRAPSNEGALLVIHDDRCLNSSFLPVLVVIDHLDRAAIGSRTVSPSLKVSESRLTFQLHTAGGVGEPEAKPADHLKNHKTPAGMSATLAG